MSIVWGKQNRKRGRATKIGALPLTSMIDVVFLLLIFFLVTSNFAQQERELPSALQTDGGGVRASDLQPQIIEIRLLEGSPIFVMGERAVRTRADLQTLLSQLPKEPGVAVKSAPEVPISAVAAALQAARDAGFTKRSYVPQNAP